MTTEMATATTTSGESLRGDDHLPGGGQPPGPRRAVRRRAVVQGCSGSQLRELIRYHELFFFLTWRDVKVRYKQTALGVAWAILQPLATMIVFTIFFGRVGGITPPNDIPYTVFCLAAIVLWTFFANSLTSASQSLVASANAC